MTLNTRDRGIVGAVASFKQLTSEQIYLLLFTDTSRTPNYRALTRLTAAGYLARIHYPRAGGPKGGGGPYVYQLGKLGHDLYRDGRYAPRHSVDFHALAIADIFLIIKAKADAGQFVINGVLTEPDCHVQVERYYLKPDLFIELTRPDGARRQLWWEIDMGTEGPSMIKDKLVRYWSAHNAADAAEWPQWPVVLFVTQEVHRRDELRWLISRGKKEAQPLFRVLDITELPRVQM